jgi:hypothetical protein
MLTRAGVLAVSLMSLTAVAAVPSSPALVGATEALKIGADTGFVDDAIAFDDQRIAYVVADGSAKTELHVMEPGKQDRVLDLAGFTLHPLSLTLVGARVFVVGLDEHDEQIGAMIESPPPPRVVPAEPTIAKGKVLWRIGPATHIGVIDREGKQRIALDRMTGTRHDVELDTLDGGKRIAAGHLDADGKTNDFRVNHWSDGWTKAYGIKGGEWDRKENQRTADQEATYDLIAGKFDKHPIGDLFEQRKRFQVLADANGSLELVRMSWDNTNLVSWHAGKPTPLELDQALGQYDPKSLQGAVLADGTTWVALKVDPVNPDAVARKKADPEYLDIFKAGPDGKAIRKMRVLSTSTRFRMIVIKDRIGLLERSSGFDRGGKTLTIYAIN